MLVKSFVWEEERKKERKKEGKKERKKEWKKERKGYIANYGKFKISVAIPTAFSDLEKIFYLSQYCDCFSLTAPSIAQLHITGCCSVQWYACSYILQWEFWHFKWVLHISDMCYSLSLPLIFNLPLPNQSNFHRLCSTLFQKMGRGISQEVTAAIDVKPTLYTSAPPTIRPEYSLRTESNDISHAAILYKFSSTSLFSRLL